MTPSPMPHSVRILEQMVRTFAETGYKQTSKNPKNNNKIPTTLPFYLNKQFILLVEI